MRNAQGVFGSETVRRIRQRALNETEKQTDLIGNLMKFLNAGNDASFIGGILVV